MDLLAIIVKTVDEFRYLLAPAPPRAGKDSDMPAAHFTMPRGAGLQENKQIELSERELARVMPLLRNVPIFLHLSEEGLHALVAHSKLRSFQANEPLIVQGSRSQGAPACLQPHPRRLPSLDTRRTHSPRSRACALAQPRIPFAATSWPRAPCARVATRPL